MTPHHPPYVSPTEVLPGIYMVQIPIPIPLKYINCYVCKGPSGWTIVDAGFHDDLAEDAWPRALGELGIRFQDVDRILITHYHPDHIGAAGWLQELTGAPAFLHEVEMEQVNRFWENWEPMSKAQPALFISEGMPQEVAAELGKHHHSQARHVSPLPKLTPVPTGSLFRIGAVEYEVLWTPGHSDGLAVFWDAASGTLMTNDMLLNKITPNVSVWPGSRPNPLDDFLKSLIRVEDLGAKIGLPGHRTVITDVAARAKETRHHHTDRLNLMERLCGGVQGATAWEVCEQVFKPSELTIHQVRFAMSETLAHLVYMERQGRLLKKGNRYVQA